MRNLDQRIRELERAERIALGGIWLQIICLVMALSTIWLFVTGRWVVGAVVLILSARASAVLGESISKKVDHIIEENKVE